MYSKLLFTTRTNTVFLQHVQTLHFHNTYTQCIFTTRTTSAFLQHVQTMQTFMRHAQHANRKGKENQNKKLNIAPFAQLCAVVGRTEIEGEKKGAGGE